jgi:hypothetical protein
MDSEDVQKALEQHDLWLNNGVGGRRANLAGACLSDMFLMQVNLRGANLAGASFSGAILNGADLSCANLADADFRHAKMGRATLAGAILARANFADADLSDTNLNQANLAGASFKRARLTHVTCWGVTMANVDLEHAIDIPEHMRILSSIVPPDGPFEMWQRCANNVYVRFRVPSDAKRTNGGSRRIRVSKALVTKIVSDTDTTEARSLYDDKVCYHLGDIVEPSDGYDDDWTLWLGRGIYGYLTREEAALM